MKQNILKTLSASLMLAIAFTFFSCSTGGDDEPSTSSVKAFDVKVETGGVEVDVVKLMVRDNDSYEFVTIAEAPYLNGGFNIDLSDNVDAKYLNSFGSGEEGYSDLGENVSISDKEAKVVWAVLKAFKDDKEVGGFRLGRRIDNGYLDVNFYYSDRDVSIKGTRTEIDSKASMYDTYDTSLKSGWNYWFEKSEHYEDDEDFFHINTTHTSTNPGGLKWIFESYEDDN